MKPRHRSSAVSALAALIQSDWHETFALQLVASRAYPVDLTRHEEVRI